MDCGTRARMWPLTTQLIESLYPPVVAASSSTDVWLILYLARLVPSLIYIFSFEFGSIYPSVLYLRPGTSLAITIVYPHSPPEVAYKAAIIREWMEKYSMPEMSWLIQPRCSLRPRHYKQGFPLPSRHPRGGYS